MTKLVRAAILPLLLTCFTFSTTFAGVILGSKVVPFRHYTTPAIAAASPSGSVGYTTSTTVLVGWIDSTSVSFNSTGGPAAVSDTTAPFSLDNWTPMPPFVLGADSIPLCVISLRPTYFRGNPVVADTMSVALQGSWNGIDWIGGVKIDLVENASSNTFEKYYAFTRTSAATATNLILGSFPLYRAIWTDWTGTTGDFEAGVAWNKNAP